MAGDEDDTLGVLAVRERDAERRDGRQAGRDAVDHLHVDACRTQVLDLLAAAAEDERIAAFRRTTDSPSRAAITISSR